MNFLAHACLSFSNPGILVGNLISDFVKGKKKFEFPAIIQEGISLHRAIDAYTDDHYATRRAQEIFRPHYRLYSGAFTDVVYDHFLANDEAVFPGNSLGVFTKKVYGTLEEYKGLLPGKFAAIFPYMKEQDWLYHYRYYEGVEKSFGGLVRRATYMNESKTAFELFKKNHDELKYCYAIFFPQVKQFAFNIFQSMRTGES